MPKIAPRRSMWFDVPDDPLKGRVEIVHLTDGDKAEIHDQVWEIRNVFDAKGENGFRSEQQYFSGRDRMLTVCRAVKSWENFLDPAGKTMACTEENKKMWAMEDGFMRFVNERRAVLAKIIEDEKAAVTKN